MVAEQSLQERISGAITGRNFARLLPRIRGYSPHCRTNVFAIAKPSRTFIFPLRAIAPPNSGPVGSSTRSPVVR